VTPRPATMAEPMNKPAGRNKPKHHRSTAPAASGSAGVAANAGPCQKYAAALCEKAGKESDTCTALTTSADILSPAACSAGLNEWAYSIKKLGEQGKSCESSSGSCAPRSVRPANLQHGQGSDQAFPPARCKSMLDHLPEIVADLKKMEQANQPLSPTSPRTSPRARRPRSARRTRRSPSSSSPISVARTVRRRPTWSTSEGKVRGSRAFRVPPVPAADAPKRARRGRSGARGQRAGQILQFHDKLFKNQGQLTRDGLEGFAKEAGLNVPEFKKALDGKTYAADVDSDVKMGESVAVSGTPTMFINGARVQNPTSFETVSAQIESALKGGSPAAPAGTPG